MVDSNRVRFSKPLAPKSGFGAELAGLAHQGHDGVAYRPTPLTPCNYSDCGERNACHTNGQGIYESSVDRGGGFVRLRARSFPR